MRGPAPSHQQTSLAIQRGMRRASNYNRILLSQFDEFTHGNVLEVGASQGNITELLLERPELQVTATDVNPLAISELERLKDRSSGQIQVVPWDLNEPAPKSLAPNSYDTVLCLNTLEHVGRDSRAIRSFFDLTKQNGYLCLAVPAFQLLYGSVDRSDRHFRRYRLPELARKVNATGFIFMRAYYFNAAGFFAWLLMGRILKRRMLGEGAIGVYDSIFPALYRLETLYRRPPFGQTVVLIAKK